MTAAGELPLNFVQRSSRMSQQMLAAVDCLRVGVAGCD
jgi:hypothetical protein